MVGTSWWTTKEKIQDKEETLRIPSLEKDILLAPPKLTVSISGETSTQAGQLEWYTVSGATVGQTGQIKPPIKPESTSRFRSSESRHPPADAYSNERQELLAAGKSVSKHLYIHDADEKRKRVECLVKLQLANGLQLGPLASKAIKVISKPSKKRQSIKNMERKHPLSLFSTFLTDPFSSQSVSIMARPCPYSTGSVPRPCRLNTSVSRPAKAARWLSPAWPFNTKRTGRAKGPVLWRERPAGTRL